MVRSLSLLWRRQRLSQANVSSTIQRFGNTTNQVECQRWGQLQRSLLNLSYGNGKVFLVPHERVRGKMQGGMIALPMPPFPTGVMRGRFHPTEGQLYLCGMFAWAGSATQSVGLYRLRATGRPIHLLIGSQATKLGIKLTFTAPLDPKTVAAGKVRIKTWSLKRTAQYGSKHFDEKPLDVRSATLLLDRKTVPVDVPDIRLTWCMEIKYEFGSATGVPVSGVIHNTIHELADQLRQPRTGLRRGLNRFEQTHAVSFAQLSTLPTP